MKTLHARSPARHRRGAFTLIEIALSLGIVGFALVGIVGAIPLAMNNSRLSIAQSRAASVAATIFTNFRAQPFGAVPYTDSATPTINLDIQTATYDPTTGLDSASVTYYAAFDEVPSSAPSSDARRLHFSTSAPTSGVLYKIILHFNNNPTGTLAPYPTTPSAPTVLHAQANAIEATITESDHPNDKFRFSSVIANRSE